MKKFRVVVLGASACGKSALVKRFVHNKFNVDYEPTIEDKYIKKTTFSGNSISLEIVDTAGKLWAYTRRQRRIVLHGNMQEFVAGQHSPYYEHADAFIVCYAVNDRKSYEHAVRIFAQIAYYRGTHSIPRVLVGTKLDTPTRQVQLDSGSVLSAQLQCSFAETSSALDINVTEIFEEIVSQIRYVEGMRKKMEDEQSVPLFCCLFG